MYKRQVFSSPLLRAVETANILFPGAAHQFTVHDLREAGFGKFEGRPVKDLVHDEDFKKWINMCIRDRVMSWPMMYCKVTTTPMVLSLNI